MFETRIWGHTDTSNLICYFSLIVGLGLFEWAWNVEGQPKDEGEGILTVQKWLVVPSTNNKVCFNDLSFSPVFIVHTYLFFFIWFLNCTFILGSFPLPPWILNPLNIEENFGAGVGLRRVDEDGTLNEVTRKVKSLICFDVDADSWFAISHA